MNKKHIFISHSGKDKIPLGKLKSLLEENYPDQIRIFLSSDGSSIRLGKNWSKEIEDGLAVSELALIALTRNSINNDWVNFETGYIYAKTATKMIPIVIGDLKMEDLTPPISLIQAMYLNDENGLIRIQQEILHTLGLKPLREFNSKDYSNIFHEKGQNDIESTLFTRIVIKLVEKSPNLITNLLRQIGNLYEIRDCGSDDRIKRKIWPGGRIQRSESGEIEIIIGAINMDASIELIRTATSISKNDIKSLSVTMEIPLGYKTFSNDYDMYAITNDSAFRFLDNGVLEYKHVKFRLSNRLDFARSESEKIVDVVGVDVTLFENLLGFGVLSAKHMKEICSELLSAGIIYQIR